MLYGLCRILCSVETSNLRKFPESSCANLFYEFILVQLVFWYTERIQQPLSCRKLKKNLAVMLGL